MKKTTSDVLQDGLIGGFVGYGVASLYFALLNLLFGRPFWYTTQAFGEALFAGSFPGQAIAFNGVHLAVFLVLGLVAAFLVEETELHPVFWYFLLVVAVVGFVAGYLFTTVVAGRLVDLNPVAVAMGNVVAAVGIGAYLLLRHPALRRIVREQDQREEDEYHLA